MITRTMTGCWSTYETAINDKANNHIRAITSWMVQGKGSSVTVDRPNGDQLQGLEFQLLAMVFADSQETGH